MPAHTDAYDRRIAEIKRQLADNPPHTLRPLYERALGLTEEALYRLSILIEATEKRFTADQENIDERMRLHAERLGRYTGEQREAIRALSAPDGSFEKSAARLKLVTLRALLSTDVSLGVTQIQQLWSYLRTKAATDLGDRLFDEIYWPDESSFKLAAVVKGIEQLAGLIPIFGKIYSALKAAYGIGTARRKRAKTAHAHVEYYEDYCEALLVWCVAAEAATRSCELFEE